VFAIAATLLVLDLTTHTIGRVSSDAELLQALAGEWGLFFNFVLSFTLLCLLWMTHTQQFEHIARVDGVVVWLNNARLLFIVLVPFVTGIATEYQEYIIGRLAMPIVFLLAVSASWAQMLWTARHREAMMPDRTAAQVDASLRAGFSAVLLSALVLVLSVWVGSIAFVVFAFDPLLTRLLQRRSASK
jgi:uncharacterized membrane protein